MVTLDKHIDKRDEFQDEFNTCYKLIADLTKRNDTLLAENKALREQVKHLEQIIDDMGMIAKDALKIGKKD